MLNEKDLPHVEVVQRMTKESDGAYNAIVNNIIVGIKEATSKGSYEFTYPIKVPVVFKYRLNEWLKNSGYTVKLRAHEKTEDRNSLGWRKEVMEVSISWS